MVSLEKFKEGLSNSQKNELQRLIDSYYYKGYRDGYSEGKFDERCSNFNDF